MPSGYTAPPFVPSHVVILSDLPAREKEDWYKFLLEENVAFSRVEKPDGTDGPRYVASVRVVAPNIPKDKALPPGLRPKKVWTSPNRERSYQEKKPESQRSPRSALVRPQLPDVMEFGPATVNLREYNGIISLLMETGPEMARLRPVTWLMRTIEDVYDARYVHDTTDLQKEMDPVEERMHDRVTRSFPAFVFEHLSKKYGLRALVGQNAWEVVLNTAVYRKENLAVEIFARFLDEMYDADDLLFFLYVRSVVQKSLNFSFRSRWVDKTVSTVKPQQDLWLSHRECTHVCRTVFGNDQDPLCREFLQIVESQLVGKKRAGPNGQDARRIEVYHFLLLAVSGYHNTRPDDEGADAVTELDGVPLTPGRSQTPDQRRLYVDGLGSRAGDADRLDMDHHLRRASQDAANDMSSFDSTRLDEYLKAIAKDRIAMNEMERSVGAVKMNNPLPPPVVVRPPAPQHILDQEDAAIALAQMQLGMEARVVEHLMGTAAEELPFDIVSEIRSQVSSQLHEKVSRKLEGRLETGGPMGPQAAQEFLQETLSEPTLLGDMETLVSLLVSYAQGNDNGGAPRRS